MNVIFARNRVGTRRNVGGGAVYITDGSAWFQACEFIDNRVREVSDGGGDIKRGGAIDAEGYSSLTITNCLFAGNGAIDQQTVQGGVLYAAGNGETIIVDSRFIGNTIDGGMNTSVNGMHPHDLYFNKSGLTRIINTALISGSTHGIYKTGTGSLAITNMLLAAYPGHGVIVNNGSVTLEHATIADNARRGVINQSGAPVTIVDSIVWGNRHGGIGGDATVSFSNVQEPHAGTGNLSVDPLFAGGNYYLSVNGLPGQVQDSPVLGVGSDTAENLGLDGLTTRTDGQTASGQVDLGYHHAAGMSAGEIARLNLFVNADTGHDVNNDGLSAGDAFKTITRALQEAVQGSTIHIAPGIYDLTLGETFPLVVPVANLGLVGSDRDNTRIDAELTSRILTTVGAGRLRLQGLTFERGFQNETDSNHNYGLYIGAGLHLPAAQTVIEDCVVRYCNVAGTGMGFGVYAWQGSLDMFDSLIVSNRYTGGSITHGAGVMAIFADVLIDNTIFSWNQVRGNHGCRGGAIYLRGSDGEIQNSAFTNNTAIGGSGSRRSYGGAVHTDHGSSLSISNIVFAGNYVTGTGNQRGGVIHWNSTDTLTVIDSVFSNNFDSGSTHDIEVTSGSLALDRVVMAGGSAHGVFSSDGTSVGITNSLIHSQPGDGIRINAGSASIASTTLADNDGWGLVFDGTDLAVENTIAWGNADGGISQNASGTATIIHTASQEAHGDPSDNNLAGQDPEFEDAAAANYRIQRSSPALDAGINRPWMVNATDLAGMQRILPGADGNYTVDLGAYETLPPSGTMFLFR